MTEKTANGVGRQGHQLVSPAKRWLIRAPAAALALWYVVGTLLVWPDYLAYFNEAAGGPANGYRWLGDSNLDWCQDQRAAETLRADPDEGFRSSVGELPLTGRVVISTVNLQDTFVPWPRYR